MRTRWHRGSKRSKTRSTGSLPAVAARFSTIPSGGGNYHDAFPTVVLGGGRGPEGGEGSAEITLVWNGQDSDSCVEIDVQNCDEVPGESIRADIIAVVNLRAFANGGIGQALPLWAKAKIRNSAADTIIGGRCSNAAKELQVP